MFYFDYTQLLLHITHWYYRFYFLRLLRLFAAISFVIYQWFSLSVTGYSSIFTFVSLRSWPSWFNFFSRYCPCFCKDIAITIPVYIKAVTSLLTAYNCWQYFFALKGMRTLNWAYMQRSSTLKWISLSQKWKFVAHLGLLGYLSSLSFWVVPTKQCRFENTHLFCFVNTWFFAMFRQKLWYVTYWNYWPELFCRDYPNLGTFYSSTILWYRIH